MIWLLFGINPTINENSTIADIKQVPRVEFSAICRENGLTNDTIGKLVSDGTTDFEVLKYASKDSLEAIGIRNIQKDVIINKFLRKEAPRSVNPIRLINPIQTCCKKFLGKCWFREHTWYS